VSDGVGTRRRVGDDRLADAVEGHAGLHPLGLDDVERGVGGCAPEVGQRATGEVGRVGPACEAGEDRLKDILGVLGIAGDPVRGLHDRLRMLAEDGLEPRGRVVGAVGDHGLHGFLPFRFITHQNALPASRLTRFTVLYEPVTGENAPPRRARINVAAPTAR